jgi:hypothetical protein
MYNPHIILDTYEPTAEQRVGAFQTWLNLKGFCLDCENEVVGIDPIDRHCLITKDGTHFTVITVRESYDFNFIPSSEKVQFGVNRAGAYVLWYVFAN